MHRNAPIVPKRSRSVMLWFRKSMSSPSAFSRAILSISSEISTPVISYPRLARGIVILPVPHARSHNKVGVYVIHNKKIFYIVRPFFIINILVHKRIVNIGEIGIAIHLYSPFCQLLNCSRLSRNLYICLRD